MMMHGLTNFKPSYLYFNFTVYSICMYSPLNHHFLINFPDYSYAHVLYPHTCYTVSHVSTPSYDKHNNIFRRVQVIVFPIMQFFLSCHFRFVRYKYCILFISIFYISLNIRSSRRATNQTFNTHNNRLSRAPSKLLTFLCNPSVYLYLQVQF
jgi:hypothetical protein